MAGKINEYKLLTLKERRRNFCLRLMTENPAYKNYLNDLIEIMIKFGHTNNSANNWLEEEIYRTYRRKGCL